MAKLLLNLRNVDEDESREVGELLDRQGIAWYRTEPSPWGISFGGIWLREREDHARAKELMAAYQAERSRRVRAEREAALRDGTAETFADIVRREPLRVAFAILGILGALALLAVVPFLLHRP